MVKKPFFKSRSIEQIKKLDIQKIDTPENLVERIENLESEKQGLILDFGISFIHPEFNDPDKSPDYNSRRALRGAKFKKWGDKFWPSYIHLKQPKSRAQVSYEEKIPLAIRNESFLMNMTEFPEHENFYVGYRYRPIIGSDHSPILVPFWSIMKGNQIDSYSQRIKKSMKSLDVGSIVVNNYGSNVIVKVPSEEKDRERYTQKWVNVATPDNRESKISAWGTRTYYGSLDPRGDFREVEGSEPMSSFWHIGQDQSRGDKTSLNFYILGNHDCAGYQQIIRNSMRFGNIAPFEMSQIAVPSREDVSYALKIDNNILIKEKDANGKSVLRHPRIDQYSMLIARRIGKRINENIEGSQRTMYWDNERDGRIREYPWLLGEE